MICAHFYHAWADGAWELPVQEHLWALRESRFIGPVTLGIVGDPSERAQVRRTFQGVVALADVVEADAGWEQVTLAAVAKHAADNDGLVLYAHTKGATGRTPLQDQWRQSMTAKLVRGWQAAAATLEDFDYDAVGCHWLTPDNPDPLGVVNAPMFGGNFWMAACEYLRSLPPAATGSRHDAEVWVGQNEPRVLDLLPGWPPSTEPFRKLGRLVVPAC